MVLSARWLRCVLFLGVFASTTRGDEPSPSVPTDRELTRRIRTILRTDAQFHDSQLLVSVVDRVAVIGGPVRSSAEEAKLRRILSIVPELTNARLSTWVPNTGTSSITTRNTDDPRPTAVNTAKGSRVRVEELPSLLQPVPRVAKMPLPSYRDSAYSPVPAPIPPGPSGPPEYPTIPSPTVPVEPVQNVTTAIEELRQADARYSSLSVRLQAGLVTVECSVNDADVAWDFVRLARKVPGVDRVIVATNPKNR